MEYSAAKERIDCWQGKRIAVVGDLMLDRYVWGGASRISQEAPIPVVEVRRTTARPGGAANVLHNIVALGGKALAFGVVGADALARGEIDALIIEDYAKGTLSPDLARAVVVAAGKHGVPVALDPHPANHLDVPALALMTPNRSEAFALAGVYKTEAVRPVEADGALREVVARLQDRWQVAHLLITLGADGMALFRPEAPPLHVPTLAREVFDVSGAGDTVITSFLLALISGATGEEAAVLSNNAPGVVVAGRGAPTPPTPHH